MNDFKICVFIDGANLYAASKTLDFQVDFDKLLKRFEPWRATYYSVLLPSDADADDKSFQKQRPMFDYLEHNGYQLVTKEAREFIDHNGARKIKGDMDVNIAVDMLEACSYANEIVLFSGDGDLLPAIEAIKRRGVFISVVSTKETAHESLRKKADEFIELKDIINDLKRSS